VIINIRILSSIDVGCTHRIIKRTLRQISDSIILIIAESFIADVESLAQLKIDIEKNAYVLSEYA